MFSSVTKVHFVGIGGIGMSGIAEILINQGFQVSGSDLQQSENTDYLSSIGAKIFIGHDASNLQDAEVCVYSSAVKPDENSETIEAYSRNIPVLRRSEMLAETSRLSYSLAMSGTHGKTTTTSMCGLILMKAGFDLFFFQAEDGIRDWSVIGVQTCALPIYGFGWDSQVSIYKESTVRYGLRIEGDSASIPNKEKKVFKVKAPNGMYKVSF